VDPQPYDLVVHGDVALPDGTLLKDGWLAIAEGRVAATSATPLSGKEIVEAPGLLVLPGFVDAHVHTRSCVDEGITATTRAAAAGGTTTVIDMPFDKPARPVDSVERFQAKGHDIEAEAVVDVALYATFAARGDLEVLRELASAGAAGFKVSTIEVDPVRFPRIPDGRLYEAFGVFAGTGRPVAAHQENQEIVFAQAEAFAARGDTAPIDHALSRPPVAETEAAGRLLDLAHWTGAHLHMVHGTLPRTFELIEWNRGKGVRATGETCLQYLLLSMDALTEQGGRAKCNPPLRSQESVDGLWAQLQDGLIDIVTSDHSPYPLHRKETENIFDAFAGMPGAETLGTLLYSEGVATGRIGLDRFVELVSSGPARTFGLETKGRLAEGADGDFVVFDPDAEWVLDEAWEGRARAGRVDLGARPLRLCGRRGPGAVRERTLRRSRPPNRPLTTFPSPRPMQLQGVLPILPTPFTDAGAIDEVSLRRLIDFEHEAGVHGVSILGFMGEAHRLANVERRQVVETVVDQAAGRFPTWVGVLAFGAAGAIEQGLEAQELGAEGVFVAPIGVQNDQVIFDYYASVAEALDIPVAIHDFPESFRTILSPDLIARMANEIDGVRYIKLEDHPVLAKMSRIQKAAPDSIGIFGGLGGVYFLEELQRGSRGIMTGFAFPEVLVAVYEAFRAGDTERAAAIFDRYVPLIRYEFQPKIGLAYRKFSYHARGIIDSTFIRPPGMQIDDYTRAELSAVIARTGLEVQRQGVQEVQP
jgi:dihydroorotase (multifunctional complex type)